MYKIWNENPQIKKLSQIIWSQNQRVQWIIDVVVWHVIASV